VTAAPSRAYASPIETPDIASLGASEQTASSAETINALLETYSEMTGLERTVAFAKSQNMRVSFGADGITLTHGFEGVAPAVEYGDQGQINETEGVDNVEDSALETNSQSVDFDLGKGQSAELAAGMQSSSGSGKAEKSQTTNRIDIHLVDITATSEKVDSAEHKNETATVTEHADVADIHENTSRTNASLTDDPGTAIAKGGSHSPLRDSNKRARIGMLSAANDQAFKQTHTSEQPNEAAKSSAQTAEPALIEDVAEEESIGFEAMAKAEEAAQAHAIARAEAMVQLEVAAQAAADAEAAAAAEAELMFETLSESALIEAELIEAFANMDPTHDTDALDAILREADQTLDVTSQLEEEREAEELLVPVQDATTVSESNLEKHAQREHSGAGSSMVASAGTGSELAVQSSSEQLPTVADYYDSLEVDLDETNSVGFGGLPTSAVSTRPQGYLSRLWQSVRRAVRNIINSPMAWIKKRK